MKKKTFDLTQLSPKFNKRCFHVNNIFTHFIPKTDKLDALVAALTKEFEHDKSTDARGKKIDLSTKKKQSTKKAEFQKKSRATANSLTKELEHDKSTDAKEKKINSYTKKKQSIKNTKFHKKSPATANAALEEHEIKHVKTGKCHGSKRVAQGPSH